MVQFIKDIISQFGGRYFGSEEEKNAQIYTKSILEKYCDKTEIVAFDSALEAHFQSFKLFCVVYLLTLAIFPFNLLGAMVLSIVNTIFFFGHLVTYRHWLDFLYAKKTSYNVIGDIEPSEKALQTIIIAGHIDSVKEFKWWYKLKQMGAVLTVVASLLFPLSSIFMLVAFVATGLWVNYVFYVFYVFILLSPTLIVLFNMHTDEVVHGANDNLTGVAMAVEMAKVFSETRLKNTRIRCISFGAEEAGLRGAWDYASKNKKQLLEEKAFLLNLDSIKDLEHLTIGTRETNTFVGYKKEDIEKMERSFRALNVAVKKLPLDVGASDASAFRILGLPALCIIGMMSDRLDPCYHTRLDNVEHLDGTAMEALKKVLVHYIVHSDKELVDGLIKNH